MKLTHWFFILCSLTLVHPWVLGQEQDKPIVVSPLIGDTLDVAEREHFGLFPNLKGFEWAVFYLNPDSSLKVKASLLEDRARRDTMIARYRTLTALQNHIGLVAQKDVEVGFKAEGREVTLILKDGTAITGELLSVRDSSLVVDVLNRAWEVDVPSHSKGIVVVRNHRVQSAVIKGKSNVLKGMGLGTLIGAGSGAIVGAARGDTPRTFPYGGTSTAREKAVAGAIGLGAVGFLVGTVVGLISSSRDKDVEPLLNQDFSSFRPVARFSEEEPESLKKIK